MNNLDLYHFPPTPASYQIRLILGEKGVPWNDFHINPLAGDDMRLDYLSLDPMARRPILVHNGCLTAGLSEIITYIDQYFKLISLSPADADNYNRMIRLIEFGVALPLVTARLASLPQWMVPMLKRCLEGRIAILNKIPRENPELTDACRRLVAEERGLLLVLGNQDIAQKATERIADRLKKINQILEKRRFLMGKRYSMADAVWVGGLCCLRDYRLSGALNLGQYPTLVAYVDRCLRRPGAEPYLKSKTTPGHWLRWMAEAIPAIKENLLERKA